MPTAGGCGFGPLGYFKSDPWRKRCIARWHRAQRKRPHEAAFLEIAKMARCRYFTFASARNNSALSVFSHENAVNVSPLSSLTLYGARPKWPYEAVG